MKMLIALALVLFPLTANAYGCGCHHHLRWYYRGYHHQDIERYGPPENGGYRSQYYGGRYHDNTYYDD